MPTYDGNGVPHYQETDPATSPGFSDLLNILADIVASKVGTILSRLTTIDTTLADRNTWNTSNPTAAIIGITLGTGGTAKHRWRILDGIYEAHFEVTLGSSGWSLGAPEFRYQLATGWKQADTLGAIIGSGWLEDVSAATRYGTMTPLASAGATAVIIRHNSGGIYIQGISNTAPFTWGAGDTLKGYIRVPVVPV